MPLSWQGRIEAANDEAEVVGVVRDFLAQISPRDLARLPAECWPGKMVDGNDVTAYGLTLMRQACSSSDATSDMVHRLVTFLSSAGVRLAQIAGRSPAHLGHARQSP
jgi:hypothetical protein